ncbi:helix-turn-helix domain-containing protein [Tuberibacillus sp. Marseille-P3662]|uniref:helix-turn-helix domain-containing protein n=1 Tax=Tuberibacillus sp. Marseille-P3662 TaxID=1965358 RepID=UPI000A1C93A0|nr:helix-turn-helix transcriptional regulator [Tuberibacillus sp. Marseille-P3662]
MDVNHRIKEIRETKRNNSGRKLSGTAVAKMLGITPQYYYEIERGEKNLSAEMARNISEIFGVTTDYLLGISDDPNDSEPKRRQTEITDKDERDIAKRMEEIKKDLQDDGGLSFSGEPMSDEAKESLLDAMEHVVRQTQRINKKYIPKKYREDKDKD